jgi:tRNA-specific 2-thiouridylase
LIERLRPGAAEPGDIVARDGRLLGRHDGVIHFTVGQRRGLGLSGPEPFYVLRIDARARQVVVGPKSALGRKMVALGEVNWLDHRVPRDGQAVQARIRSTHAGADATLLVGGAAGHDGEAPEALSIELVSAAEAVAPGQACVLYDGDHVLGGGWIARNEAIQP